MGAVVMVDVSSWQRTMNWGVTARKAQACYIRATMARAGVDGLFQVNWVGAKAAGMARGAYHLFMPRAEPARDPKLQAENFFKTLGNDLGELPPMLDCEVDPDLIGKSAMIERIQKFIDEFARLSGRQCGIYTRATWWDAEVASDPGNTDLPRAAGQGMRKLWVAHYNQIAARPWVPFDWYKRYGQDGWTFWQWSADGNNKGAEYGAGSPSIDLNRYNGDVAKFNAEFKTAILDLADAPPPPAVEQEYEVTAVFLNLREEANAQSKDLGNVMRMTKFISDKQEEQYAHLEGWVYIPGLRDIN